MSPRSKKEYLEAIYPRTGHSATNWQYEDRGFYSGYPKCYAR